MLLPFVYFKKPLLKAIKLAQGAEICEPQYSIDILE